MPETPIVLIVDDEIALAEIGSEWLRRRGFHTMIAGDGEAAWKILQTQKVDVVVTDVRMPMMGGVALLERIYSLGAGAPRVLFATAYSDFDPRDAYDLGLEAVLIKPIRRQQLEAGVEDALSYRNLEGTNRPSPTSGKLLKSLFPSIAGALAGGLIALGRRGFCLANTFRLTGATVPLDLEFEREAQRIAGQGVVRWSDYEQQQIGVEITYLEDDCRAWVVKLLADNGALSLIPREPAPAH